MSCTSPFSGTRCLLQPHQWPILCIKSAPPHLSNKNIHSIWKPWSGSKDIDLISKPTGISIYMITCIVSAGSSPLTRVMSWAARVWWHLDLAGGQSCSLLQGRDRYHSLPSLHTILQGQTCLDGETRAQRQSCLGQDRPCGTSWRREHCCRPFLTCRWWWGSGDAVSGDCPMRWSGGHGWRLCCGTPLRCRWRCGSSPQERRWSWHSTLKQSVGDYPSPIYSSRWRNGRVPSMLTLEEVHDGVTDKSPLCWWYEREYNKWTNDRLYS